MGLFVLLAVDAVVVVDDAVVAVDVARIVGGPVGATVDAPFGVIVVEDAVDVDDAFVVVETVLVVVVPPHCVYAIGHPLHPIPLTVRYA